MYPDEFTRNPFFAVSEQHFESLTYFQGARQERCSWGGCSSNYTIVGTQLCEEHALQVFDQMIVYKGYDYMLARAGGVKAALEFEKERVEKRLSEQRERATREGWVYYIEMGDLIKIGYAQNIWGRTKAYPPTAKFLAAHPGTPTLERTMHHRFAHLLAEGREWFRVGDDLLEHIDQVLRQFPKQPKPYEFRKNTPTFKKVA